MEARTIRNKENYISYSPPGIVKVIAKRRLGWVRQAEGTEKVRNKCIIF
jgi:hypothetical protein